ILAAWHVLRHNFAMPRKTQIGPTLQRLFWLCCGIVLLAIALIGKGFDGAQIAPWRRLGTIIAGLGFTYIGLMYYLPKYRKQREELDKTLDDLETELRDESHDRRT